jgi:hypothetical protein
MVSRIINVKFVSVLKPNATVDGQGQFLTTYSDGKLQLHTMEDFKMEQFAKSPDVMKQFLIRCQSLPNQKCFMFCGAGEDNCKAEAQLSWPFQVQEASNFHCAVNACRNVGIEPESLVKEFSSNPVASLKEVVTFVMRTKKKAVTFHKVTRIEPVGTFLAMQTERCLSIINGVCLDAAVAVTFPLESCQGPFDLIYKVCDDKKEHLKRKRQ